MFCAICSKLLEVFRRRTELKMMENFRKLFGNFFLEFLAKIFILKNFPGILIKKIFAGIFIKKFSWNFYSKVFLKFSLKNFPGIFI